MDDDEIMTMIVAAGVQAQVPITGVKIVKKSVIVSAGDSTMTLRKATLPGWTVNKLANEIIRRLGDTL